MNKFKIREELTILFWIFIIGSIAGFIFEMIVVFFQKGHFELRQGLIYGPFNINGRTSLLHCIYWGIGGILYITYIEPFIEKMKQKMNKNIIKIITTILAIFIIFDITISWMAAERQIERKSNIEPENKMDLFFDKYYPDEYIDRIYNNKKYVF